jgi:Leucine-rich repeat (LRR) protein
MEAFLELIRICVRGVLALIDQIIYTPKLRVLILAGNELTDESVMELLENLQISHHYELQELDLDDNKLTDATAETLCTFISDFKDLQIIKLQNNK